MGTIMMKSNVRRKVAGFTVEHGCP